MTNALAQIAMAELIAKLNEPGTKAAIASGLSRRFAPAKIDSHIQATVRQLSRDGLPQDTIAASRLASGVESLSAKSGHGPAPAGLVGTAVVCEQILCDWHSSGQLREQATRAASAIDSKLHLKGRLAKLVDRAATPAGQTHQPAAGVTELVQQASDHQRQGLTPPPAPGPSEAPEATTSNLSDVARSISLNTGVSRLGQRRQQDFGLLETRQALLNVSQKHRRAHDLLQYRSDAHAEIDPGDASRLLAFAEGIQSGRIPLRKPEQTGRPGFAVQDKYLRWDRRELAELIRAGAGTEPLDPASSRTLAELSGLELESALAPIGPQNEPPKPPKVHRAPSTGLSQLTAPAATAATAATGGQAARGQQAGPAF